MKITHRLFNLKLDAYANGSHIGRTGFLGGFVRLSIACGLVSGAIASDSPPIAVERQAYLMGTTCTVTIYTSERKLGLDSAEAAFEAITATEEQLSTWRDDTVLAGLNRSIIDTPFQVTPEMYRLFERLREFSDRTGGAFDPAAGHLLEAWDIRGSGRTPSHEDRTLALAASGMNLLRFDETRSTVTRLSPGAQMDAGAFGKGEALAQAAAVLRARGVSNFTLDFGGQILVGPDTVNDVAFVADPSQRDRSVGQLRLRGLSAATSTQNVRVGHIIDPRTGSRAEAFGSVTAVSSDPLVADALSTALFVMGPDAGLTFATEFPDLEALYLVQSPEGLRARMTPGMHELLLTLNVPTTAGQDTPCRTRSLP